MSLRAFLALALTTVLVLIATIAVLTSQNAGPAAREPGTAILPELAANLNAATHIVMTRAGEKTNVRRIGSGDDAQWVVEEFFNYPSHNQYVRDLLASLARLQTLEPKTSRPALYSKLDVEDPTSSTARSTRLEIFAEGEKKLADIIIGKTKSALAGQESLYVRRPDEDRAWLAKGKIDAPYNRLGWVDNQFLVIDLPRVKYATLNRPAKGPRVHVFKNNKDERDFTIEGMPPDYEVKDIFAAEDVARVIQQLSFEDVRPADKFKLDTAIQPWAEFVTFDGLKINLWLEERDGKNWVAVRALPAPDAPAAEKAPEKASEAAAESGEKPRDIAAEIKAINERVAPWVYAIPSYENGNLRKTLDDLIEKKKDDKDAKGN